MKRAVSGLGSILILPTGCATSQPEARDVKVYIVAVETRDTRPEFEVRRQFEAAGCELLKKDSPTTGPGWEKSDRPHETENRAIYIGSNRVLVVQFESFPGALIAHPEDAVTNYKHFYRCPNTFEPNPSSRPSK
jgi:hypothetical protein